MERFARVSLISDYTVYDHRETFSRRPTLDSPSFSTRPPSALHRRRHRWLACARASRRVFGSVNSARRLIREEGHKLEYITADRCILFFLRSTQKVESVTRPVSETPASCLARGYAVARNGPRESKRHERGRSTTGTTRADLTRRQASKFRVIPGVFERVSAVPRRPCHARNAIIITRCKRIAVTVASTRYVIK